MAERKKTLATREVNGKTIRYVLQQPVGEYDVRVIPESIKGDPTEEATYEISRDGKLITTIEYIQGNFYLEKSGVLTGPHFRAFSTAVFAAVEAASAKPRRQRRKPAPKAGQ